VAADRDAEMGSLSLTRFGSLKRAHISRAKTSGTSFYLRVGALGKFRSVLCLGVGAEIYLQVNNNAQTPVTFHSFCLKDRAVIAQTV
jgi:hypothetical protein